MGGRRAHHTLALSAALVGVCLVASVFGFDSDSEEELAGHRGEGGDSGELVFRLEHCLGHDCDGLKLGPESGFTRRGTFKHKWSDHLARFVPIVVNNPLDPAHRSLFEGDGQYMVRLVKEKGDGVPVVASVNTCWLRASGLRDNIRVRVSADGTPVSLDYRADADPGCNPNKPATLTASKFRTAAEVEAPLEFDAIEFPTDERFSPRDPSSPSKPKEQQAPSGILGLFKQYWYIIVPLMLMLSVNPEAQQRGAAGAAGGAGGGGGGGGGARR